MYVIYFDTNFESYSQPTFVSSPLSFGLYVIYFDTNFESYSQHILLLSSADCSCMLSTLIQILKAIHNLSPLLLCSCPVVCYLLWYKFWKLFTTYGLMGFEGRKLYVIYFDTNFESYSQHLFFYILDRRGCMLSTLIQILKAIHNACARAKLP